MPTYTHLKGFPDIRKTLLTQTIAENLKDWFRWGFLESEAFTNVPVTSPGVDDPYAQEKMFPVHMEGVVDGTIWQAVNTDWVYETGLEVASQPTIASGVYVNGTFYPTSTTTGTYSHYINFPGGQVIFDNPLPLTAVVQVDYAWRWISLYDQNVPWFRDVVFDALLIEQQANTTNGQGVISLLDQFRVQPPLVVVEPVMTRRMKGLELGSGAQTIYQDVLFHIITERSEERNNLLDIITFQKDKTFLLYDVNARRAADDYELDWRGMTRPGKSMYPQLVESLAWKRCVFNRMIGEEVTLKLPLYRGIVRAALEVDLVSM